MSDCPTCGNPFHRLESGAKCGLCQLRKPGMTAPELRAINNKPQCMTCGIVSTLLENPICKVCINFYRNCATIPTALLQHAGIISLLTVPECQQQQSAMYHGSAEQTQAILTSAQTYQKQASDPRFNQKASTALGATGGINLRLMAHKNVEKALAKRDETKLILGKGVRIAATLWKAQAAKDHKLIEISGLRAVKVFEPSTIAKKPLDDLLEDIKPSFEKRFPQAETLNWGNITVYAHGNKQQCYVLNFDYSQS